MAAEVLINGFDTSYSHTGVGGTKTINIIGGDAVEAFSAAHTREDGGTNLNNVVYDGTTYSLPFDYAALKAAHRTAALIKDPRGNPFPMNLDTLVCKKGSSVHFKALEILGAIKKGLIPESNDNDGSAAGSFKIIALDYLTSDLYWYMFDSSRALTANYGFQWVESEANNVDNVNYVFKTREMQFAGHSVFDYGFNDVARCWVASGGDSSKT